MEKLVRSDPVGAFHGLIKYHSYCDEAQEVVKHCQLVDNTRFKYRPGPMYPIDRLDHKYTYKRHRCSFCKRRGHTIKVCRFLLKAKCTRCHALGHRASHCPGTLSVDMASCCKWTPLLLNRAFTKAILTEDLAWLDEILDHDFTIGFEWVIKIKSVAFRNQVLERLFGWWLDHDGRQAFMGFLHYNLNECIRKLARVTRPGSRRFVLDSRLGSRARDLRYIYTFGLLYGASPHPVPNYSFLKVVAKPCRRIFANTISGSSILLPDLVQIIAAYLFF